MISILIPAQALLSCHDLIDDLHERSFLLSPLHISLFFHISYCLNVSLLNVGWLGRVGTEMYGLSFLLSLGFVCTGMEHW